VAKLVPEEWFSKMVVFRIAVLRQVSKLLIATPRHQTRSICSSKPLQALYFTKKHEWVDVDGDSGIVGISNYAQEALGDIVYAQLPNIDDVVTREDDCGALESVKAASELYSPVSGTVTHKNDNIESVPSLINTSPMKDGWLFKVKLSDLEELKELMNQEAYDKYLKEDDESDN